MWFRGRRDSGVGWLGFSLLNNKESPKVLGVLGSELHFRIGLAAMAEDLREGILRGWVKGMKTWSRVMMAVERETDTQQDAFGRCSLWAGTRLGSSEGV